MTTGKRRARAMEFIQTDKSRRLTFRNRSIGLKKKTAELATLCGIDACLIVYDRSSPDGSQPEPLLWPPDAEHLSSIINRCRQLRGGGKKRCTKASDGELADGLLGRTTKDTTKVQVSVPGNYTWDDEPLNDLSGEQLKRLLTSCESKFDFVKSRAAFLRTRMSPIAPPGPAATKTNPNCFAPPLPDSVLPAPTTTPDINPHCHPAPLQWIPQMVDQRPSNIHPEYF